MQAQIQALLAAMGGATGGVERGVAEVSRCYDLKLKGISNKTTLVLSNTRELNRVPSTE